MIKTERLILLPLTHAQLLKYIKNDHSLEAELQLHPSSQVLELDFQLVEALENAILPRVADPRQNYLFSTLWTMILTSENCMIGDLCFKGEPNEDGEIEIGYGTYEAYQGKGYMTEAVGGIIKWAATQPKVKAITAETETSNVASMKILERHHFRKFYEVEKMAWWQLDLK